MSLTLQDLSNLPESLHLHLKARSQGVEAVAVSPMVQIELEAPIFGIGPQRLSPLWHSTSKHPRMRIEVENTTDATKVLRFANCTVDSRFRLEYERWIYSIRTVSEQEGGAAAEAQDGVRPDGSMSMLLLPREKRDLDLEFRIPLETGVEACNILHSIDISVDGAEPMRVTSLLVLEHPPANLLDDLPGIYREAMEEMSADLTPPETPFFTRYLRGFEDSIDPIREALNKMEVLFGPYSTPPDFLTWLAAWVCMPLDENWPEMKRRKLIEEAVELFRWRGTARGLSRFLRIYTGVTPRIYDQPQPAICLGETTLIGAPDAVIGDIPDHTFTVTIAHPAPETLDERIINAIIESEKPAHAAYRLMILRQESHDVPSESSYAY